MSSQPAADPPAKTTMSLRARKKKPPAKRKEAAAEGREPAAKGKRKAQAGEDGLMRVDAGNTCRLCDQSFSSIQECASHIVDAHLEALQLCPHCSRAFLVAAELSAHVAKHKRRGDNISCAHCSVHFTKPSMLEQHEYESHELAGPGMLLARHLPHLSASLKLSAVALLTAPPGRSLACRVCKRACATRAACVAHARVDCGKRKYVCDKCAGVFRTQKALVDHCFKSHKCARGGPPSLVRRRPAGVRRGAVRCRRCRGKFDERRAYQEHACLVGKCNKCDLEFETLPEYHAHYAAQHRESLKTLNCPYCRMEFISAKTRARHVRQHEKYTCLRCGKKFRTPKPLLLHIKTAHADAEPYRCLLCDVSFREGLRFKQHIGEHGESGYIRFDENHYVTYSEVPPEEVEAEKEAEIEEAGKEADASENEVNVSREEANVTGGEENVTGEEANVTGEDANAADNNGVTEGDVKTLDNNEEETDAEEKPQVEAPVVKRRRGRPRKVDSLSAEPPAASRPAKRGRGRPRKAPPGRGATAVKVRRQGLFAEKTYRCTVCGKRTGTLDSFNKHVNMHFRMGAKQCARCAKLFRGEAQLRRHVEQEHRDTAGGSRLQRFLKERAARKLEALRAARRQHRPRPPAPPPPPFRVRLRRVAPPTHDLLRAATHLSADGTGVTITHHAGPPPDARIGDLTVQKYVASFQPGPDDEEEQTHVQSGPVRLVTTNKSLRVWSVSSRNLRRGFAVQMRRFRDRPLPAGGARLARPQPFKPDRSEPTTVTVGIVEEAELGRASRLNLGERHAPCGDVYDADYFETDEHSVAQVEVLSTPAAGAAGAAAGGGAGAGAGGGGTFYLELTDAEPSTADIEKSLADVCAKLDAPKSTLHIGQLTTRAPFYKIINVKKAKKKLEKQKTEEDIQKRFERVKIGGSRMVPVNPLEHLLKKAKEQMARSGQRGAGKDVGKNINIISVERSQ